MKKLSISAPIAMVLASAMFALMGIFIKLAAAQYNTAELVFYRSLLGVLVTAILAWKSGEGLATERPAAHLLRSLAGTSAMGLWFYSLATIPLSLSVTLNYTSSIWVALFYTASLLWVRKFPRLFEFAAVVIGFLGVILVVQPAGEGWDVLGVLAGLFCGIISAAVYMQLANMMRSGEPSSRIVFYLSVTGVVVGGGLASLQGWNPIDLRGFLLLLALSVTAAVGQILMTQAYGNGKPIVAASLQYLGIVFSALAGFIFFNEALTPTGMIGMLLIVAAGIGASYFQSKTRQTQAPASGAKN